MFIVSINTQDIVSKQIEEMRQILSKKWYEFINTTLTRAIKNRWIPDAVKEKASRRFFDCVASLMTHNLQDIAMRSLTKFTEFMSDVSVNIAACGLRSTARRVSQHTHRKWRKID